MKTYKQVIAMLAERVFSRYMGGSNEPYYGIDTGLVSFIYGADKSKPYADIEKEFDRIRDAYYEGMRKRGDGDGV